PAAPPANGAACVPFPAPDAGYFSASSADCSWGDDPRPSCRTKAVCTGGHWQLTSPDASCTTTPPLPAGCPAVPPANATVCSSANLACWYPDGTRCWCSGCMGGSQYPICQPINPPNWYCAMPAAGCPKVIPQAGTPC